MSGRWSAIAWIAASSALCVAGQLLAKAGLARADARSAALPPAASEWWRVLVSPMVVGGGLLLVAGTLLWFRVLPRVDFSLAMPLSCVLTLVLSVAGGILVFGESLPAQRSAGLLLALVAVWLIGAASTK